MSTHTLSKYGPRATILCRLVARVVRTHKQVFFILALLSNAVPFIFALLVLLSGRRFGVQC